MRHTPCLNLSNITLMRICLNTYNAGSSWVPLAVLGGIAAVGLIGYACYFCMLQNTNRNVTSGNQRSVTVFTTNLDERLMDAEQHAVTIPPSPRG